MFVHPVQDERVMAGNGTIGLEILDDLPDPDRVLVPFGGGGLSVGIASAVKALRPETRDLRGRARDGSAADSGFRARRATTGRVPGLVRGRLRLAGGATGDVATRARGARRRVRVSLDETAAAVRLLAERARVVAEGAGALALATALASPLGRERRLRRLRREHRRRESSTQILAGETP